MRQISVLGAVHYPAETMPVVMKLMAVLSATACLVRFCTMINENNIDNNNNKYNNNGVGMGMCCEKKMLG